MDALKPNTDNHREISPEVDDDQIAWFRQASPYINTHRGKTFVLCFSGQAIESSHFPTLVHDITLLRNLGIRLVLVHGLRVQIDQALSKASMTSSYEEGLRVTTEKELDIVLNEVGRARITIESRLSMGMPNTPMSGAHVSVASGNFVTAQPYGVINGTDFCHTGMVRQIHTNAIRRQIDNGQLVLLSPIGYSRTGDVFNLQCEEIATSAAVALNAEKLIFISSARVTDEQGETIRESTPKDMKIQLDQLSLPGPDLRVLQRAMDACEAGVERVHLLDQNDPDALLKDLFTRDGSGTMINIGNYDTIRTASIRDVGGITELIAPLEIDGTLVKRSREQLELDIANYLVAERDGTVIACAALQPDISAKKSDLPRTAEIACVVTHPNYRNSGRAEQLLRHLEERALSLGINVIYVLTTRTNHFFIEQGYAPATVETLPAVRRDSFNALRNSKILVKTLKR